MDILLGQTTNSTNIAAFLPLVLMFGIIYFIVIRPQSKQRKEHENMLKILSKGDKILTRGGVFGSIVAFQGKNDSIVKVEIATSNIINIDRNYIVKVIPK